MDYKWFFIDFDGVICYSLEECYQSSWLTWASIEVTEELPPRPTLTDRQQADFLACRPFIRSGEDYVVLHFLLEKGALPHSQSEFDAALADLGSVRLSEYKKKLYETREKLLQHHKGLWLSWNPLYPGMAKTLSALKGQAKVRILSTKKAEFIVEILRFEGVDWPLENTIYSGSRKKLSIIEELTQGEKSLLVDDQIDHLDFSHPSCDCRLALWGFVQADAIKPETPTLSLEQAQAILQPKNLG